MYSLDLDERRVDDLGRRAHALELERRLDEPHAVDDPVAGTISAPFARRRSAVSWISGAAGDCECHSMPTEPVRPAALRERVGHGLEGASRT